MDLMEYQAKELFAKHGVTTTIGTVVTTPEEARAAAGEIGPCVVKAQVKTGGRGKAGGVKVAKSPDEAKSHAEQILGMDIKGHTVHRVMIASGARIAEEYYFSILLDRANRSYLAMCSKEGGMDIEQLAVERPEALAKIEVDPNVGIDDAKDATSWSAPMLALTAIARETRTGLLLLHHARKSDGRYRDSSAIGAV